MRDVVLAGVGMTPFGKFLETGLKTLGRSAVEAALEDAGIEAADLQAAYVGNAVAGLITGQETIRGQVILNAMGIGGLPVFNVDNACASGASALHLAWLAVASGQYDCVLALGVEKMTHADKARTFNAIASGLDVEAAAEEERAADSGVTRSVFMDYYAHAICEYMDEYGLTQAQIAEVASKNHHHASLNPLAQYRNRMTVAEVLADKPVVHPLTRAMCSPVADGGAAAVVCSEAFARRIGAHTVRVAASTLRSASLQGSGDGNVINLAASAAYEEAGIGPGDVRVFEVHDATASAEIEAYEQLGLCARGESPALIADGATRLGGRTPVNTSGGLECRGHPVGATGMAQVCELAWQLRGDAGDRQVDGEPKVALAQNAGGHLGHENATCAVTILCV